MTTISLFVKSQTTSPKDQKAVLLELALTKSKAPRKETPVRSKTDPAEATIVFVSPNRDASKSGKPPMRLLTKSKTSYRIR